MECGGERRWSTSSCSSYRDEMRYLDDPAFPNNMTHTNTSLIVEMLDEYYFRFKRQILQYQSCTLGLFPSIGSKSNPSKVAYVRDSIYCAMASWAMAQAYRRIDDDRGRNHELSQACVKCMRGILFCWIRQADRVEVFKKNQSPKCALHSVFDMITGDSILEDEEYDHLQIDVVALYLLTISQMTTSGLQIVYTTDEVNFIQNLVFYVERAYRTPDFGMWERGSKYNNGITELHASSIGMAKAALEAVNGCNMFGENGAAWSVIFVDIDAHNRNRTIFESILPRESSSKNTDASLLPTLCWPAFAIHENPIKYRAMGKVMRRLKGRFGIKRFLRDGYKTIMEDKARKYYRPAEVKNFDNIECEWPMFLIYMIIDCHFRRDKVEKAQYMEELQSLLFSSDDGQLVPKYYYVPRECVEQERANPGSQTKVASPEGTTAGVFLWGQSLFIIAQLLNDELLLVNELDVIRRYLPALERPKYSTRYSKFQGTAPDLVIQVVLMAESVRLQQLLATYGIQTQTPHQVEPIQIWSPKELTKAYSYLGVNSKLGLTGRPSRPFGVLSTCKIYRALGHTFICYPLLFEISDFYLAQDISLVMDDCKNDLAFLSKCWKLHGRPTWCMVIRENAIKGQNFGEFLGLLAQIKKGMVDGIHVRLGKLQSFTSSACLEHLDFLQAIPDTDIFQPFEEKQVSSSFKSLTDIPTASSIKDDFHLTEMELEHKSTPDLMHYFKSFSGFTNQASVLKILYQRDANTRMDGVPIKHKMELLITRAGVHKKWSVVRLLSGMLEKLVDSLAPSITTILVRGKQVTIGVFGKEEEVLDKPMAPNELKTLLYKMCAPHDIRQAVLQQELIIAIGKFISFNPSLFDGILKIRIGWIVQAMKMEITQEGSHIVDIHSLSPHRIKELLYGVLTRNKKEGDLRTPLQKRQLDGALNRVPRDFYSRVWKILEKTPGGIKVAGYLLPQQPTQSDMTMYELNFSLLVEQMLSKVVEPVYRQLIVEAFMVVSTILERNPELSFRQSVQMDKIMSEAFEEFRKDLQLEHCSDQDVTTRFFNTPPNVRHGTTAYIAKAVMKELLDGDMRCLAEDILINKKDPCLNVITFRGSPRIRPDWSKSHMGH
ncbi:phosphorylase b kinase regulatory subunit beta-like isoform X2 [Littorina saxatilis]|uniref:phosphorylase b kinase regulatory subunit beta-like isoform X2 n=1 Tax=Littorina saxatilis TaxID=31220 RepID=UPI0038B68730